jgi:hypothetical protein
MFHSKLPNPGILLFNPTLLHGYSRKQEDSITREFFLFFFFLVQIVHKIGEMAKVAVWVRRCRTKATRLK